MTDKELYTQAGVSKTTFYKLKKLPGFPHTGTNEDKIAFLVLKKDHNKGRIPNKAKKGLITSEKAHSLAIEREELDAAKVHDQIMKNHWKILATRDTKFSEILNEFVQGFLEDCKQCDMNKKQLSTLQVATSERLKTLEGQLKELRQA